MVAEQSVNMALNCPMPNAGTYKSGSIMEASIASMLECRASSWMSPLIRLANFTGGIQNFNTGNLLSDFVYAIQGVGFVSRTAVSSFEFQLGHTADVGVYIDRQTLNGNSFDVEAGKYYHIPVDNGLSMASLGASDAASKGFPGSWPMTDHQWCLQNFATANIPYSRGFEHTLANKNLTTGIPSGATYHTNSTLKLTVFQNCNLLFFDIYGQLFRRS